MKRILIVSLLLLSILTLQAQQNLEDVIYLKSGKVVRGQILEQSAEEVKILVLGRYKFIYQQSEIEKVAKEPATSSSNFNSVSPGVKSSATTPKVKEQKPASPNGYLGIIEFGYGLAQGDYGMEFLKISSINGYRFNEHISLGLGFGFRQFNDMREYEFMNNGYYPELYNNVLIPIFLDLRINLSKGKGSPYLVLDAGKTFDSDMMGLGSMFSPGAGFKFGIGAKSTLSIGISYDAYKMPFYNWNTDKSSTESSNAVSFNLGISY